MKSITQVMQNLVKPYIDTKDKAYAANIAPVEVSPAEAAHTAGTQLIYNGVLYDVTADIAINDDLATEGAGANISAASKVTEQISSVNEALANEVETRAALGAHNLFDFEGWLSKYNVPFTKSGDTYSLSSNYTLSENVYQFADSNIPVIFSAELTNGTGTIVFKLLDSSNNEVGRIDATHSIVTGNACKIKHDYAANGTYTLKAPLLKLATDADTTYQPYAMTNRELTEAKAEKSDLVSISQTGSTATQAISTGTYFYLNGSLVKAKTDIANGATFTLNTNYEVATNGVLNSIALSRYHAGTAVKTIANKYVATADSAFSVAKRSLVFVQANVNYAWPDGLGIVTSVSDDITDLSSIHMRVTNDSGVGNSPVCALGIINPGIYYVAIKGSATHAAGCAIYVSMIDA